MSEFLVFDHSFADVVAELFYLLADVTEEGVT